MFGKAGFTLLAGLAALLFSAGAFYTVPATAQDYMEEQRCIWRCENATGGRQPAYNQCIARNCDGGSAKRSSSKRTGATSSAPPLTADYSTMAEPGKWGYGAHPVLGQGAFVNVGEETFGVVCPRQQGDSVSALRMTKGLYAASSSETSGLTTAFTGPFQIDGISTWELKEPGFYEVFGDICRTKVPELMKSSSFVLVNGRGHGISGAGTDYVLSVETENGMVDISSESDLNRIQGNTVISLSGSSRAIRRVVDACPALRQQIADGCGP